MLPWTSWLYARNGNNNMTDIKKNTDTKNILYICEVLIGCERNKYNSFCIKRHTNIILTNTIVHDPLLPTSWCVALRAYDSKYVVVRFNKFVQHRFLISCHFLSGCGPLPLLFINFTCQFLDSWSQALVIMWECLVVGHLLGHLSRASPRSNKVNEICQTYSTPYCHHLNGVFETKQDLKEISKVRGTWRHPWFSSWTGVALDK